MGRFHRRFPRYVRPYPFAAFLVLGALGIWLGAGAHVSLARQTGNFFLLFSLPEPLLHLEAVHVTLVFAGALSWMAALSFGTVSERAITSRVRLRRGMWSARFRFYPLTLLFGLFVLYFGLLFLFDANVAADDTLGGLVIFVYLNYAGLLDRPSVTAIGLFLTILGTACATEGAFAAGLGTSPPRPAPTPGPTFPVASVMISSAPRPSTAASPRPVARQPAGSPPMTFQSGRAGDGTARTRG